MPSKESEYMRKWMARKTPEERHAIYARRYAREKARGIYDDPERRRRQRDHMHEKYWADPGAARAKVRAQRRANPEAVRLSWHRWYSTHRDEYLARLRITRVAQRDVLREKRRLLQQTEKVRRQKSQRQSIRQYRERGAPGDHTLQEWLDKCVLLGNVCIYCGEAGPLTRDHKLPIVRGGTNDITNIVPACVSCNSAKKDRTPAEFLALSERRAA